MELKEAAEKFEGKTTKNVADIAKIPVNAPLEERTYKKTNEKGEEEEFRIKVVIIDGEEYRMPISVIKQLQIHLQANPKIKYFKVIRTGTGINDTKYTVIPLGE